MDREHRLLELIADLEAIPMPLRSSSQSYELLALRLALMIASRDHANEMERFMAQKFERPVGGDARDERHWDVICRRGPELLMLMGTEARNGGKKL